MGDAPDTPANRGAKAVALSLLLYPGGGQYFYGAKTRGLVLGGLFTVAFVGFLYHLISNLKNFYEVLTRQLELADITPALPHLGGWLAASAILWLVTGIDAFLVGRAAAPVSVAETPESPTESPPPAQDETNEDGPA